jgi:hypothetical protein
VRGTERGGRAGEEGEGREERGGGRGLRNRLSQESYGQLGNHRNRNILDLD